MFDPTKLAGSMAWPMLMLLKAIWAREAAGRNWRRWRSSSIGRQPASDRMEAPVVVKPDIDSEEGVDGAQTQEDVGEGAGGCRPQPSEGDEGEPLLVGEDLLLPKNHHHKAYEEGEDGGDDEAITPSISP